MIFYVPLIYMNTLVPTHCHKIMKFITYQGSLIINKHTCKLLVIIMIM